MSTDGFSRRRFFEGLALAAVGMAVETQPGFAASPPPPKEGGLSSEGLLAGSPGFQRRTVAPLPHNELPGFLSRSQLSSHHAQYARAVESLRATELELAAADRDPANIAAYAALRRNQVGLANEVRLHEFYFRNLAPSEVSMPAYLRPHMREHMGSPETWSADFMACALAARGWAALVYDPYDDRWHNVLMDGDAEGAWIGANPLVICDVAEHAYSTDYKRKEDYLTKFIEHVDWNEVAARYKVVDRM